MDNSVPSTHRDLDPHQAAPEELKQFFKLLKGKSTPNTPSVLDSDRMKISNQDSIPNNVAAAAFIKFSSQSKEGSGNDELNSLETATTQISAYTVEDIPGLIILPSALPNHIQERLLSRLLHRDLVDPRHQTNLHTHYNVKYPPEDTSFFDLSPDAVLFNPKDSAIHKPLSIKQVLSKKLRWMTLGGQYDWTNKIYPSDPPPAFPSDIALLITTLFPTITPEAAIVNIYSPGDTLSMHRDISEEGDHALISISLGCECIFVIGLEDPKTLEVRKAAIRLRSGDVLVMSGESRFAWHGVPRIVPDTCPEYLCAWPGEGYEGGWMRQKRVNVNIRQMRI